jgi:hypothetical protein
MIGANEVGPVKHYSSHMSQMNLTMLSYVKLKTSNGAPTSQIKLRNKFPIPSKSLLKAITWLVITVEAKYRLIVSSCCNMKLRYYISAFLFMQKD